MICGGQPFQRASVHDDTFMAIINGGLDKLLNKWRRAQYVNEDIMELFSGFFQFESERIDMVQIKQSKFYKS